jgi:predicted DNA-binding protein (MmcQ/YjbR family)
MPHDPAKSLQTLKQFGLSLPGTAPKSPWPGHDDVAVNDKTFAYLSVDEGSLKVSVKLPGSGPAVLALPHAEPTGYGLGKSGWVSLRYGPQTAPPMEQLLRWMLESYRAQAPKRLLKALYAEQPWIEAGGMPDAFRR